MDSEINHESWALGYRAAVCDLIPVPEKAAPVRPTFSPVFIGYLIGLLVGYIAFKFSKG